MKNETGIGSLAWWKTGHKYGRYGICHVIAEMVAQHEISPMKAVELFQALENRETATEIPPAPWMQFSFGLDPKCAVDPFAETSERA